MPGGVEEETKEQLSALPSSPPTSTSTPLFQRRQLTPARTTHNPSSPPSPTDTPPTPHPAPTSSPPAPPLPDSLPATPSLPSLPPVDEDDDVTRLTDLDIAAIPIPTLPPYPAALLDPPSALSPTLSPSPSPRSHHPPSSSSSHPNPHPTSTPLHTLLTPYLTAYTSSQHTLLSSYTSLTHLHSKATTDASHAVKSCTKKQLSLSNWADVQHHVRLVGERLGKCRADVERCVKEVAAAREGVGSVKEHLVSYAARVQAECVAWVGEEEGRVKAAEEALEAERAQAELRQAELLQLRSANIAAFQVMDDTRAAVQAEEEEGQRVGLERQRVDALIAQLQHKREAAEERVQHTQQATADRQKQAVEGDERWAQLRKEVQEMTAIVAQQQQRLQAVQEEEANVQAEERAMQESVRAEKAEVERTAADVGLVQLRLTSEKAEYASVHRERRKKRALYTQLTSAVRGMKEELDEWEADKREADLSIARVGEREQAATSRLLRAQQALSHVQSERGLLERGVEWAERGERKASTMLKLRRAQVPHLHAEEQQAEAKVRVKQREKQRIQDDCHTLQQRLEQVKEQVSSMQLQVDEDQLLQAEVAAEVARLQGKLQRQSAVLEEMEEERAQLRRKVCDLSTSSLREKQRMEGKRREVEEWKKRIARVDKERQASREGLARLQATHRQVATAIARVGERTAVKEAATTGLTSQLAHLSSLHRTCLHEHDLERHQLQAIVGEERVLQATLIRRQSDAAQAWEALHTLQAKTVQARRQAAQQRRLRREKEAAREAWQAQLTASLADCEEARRLGEEVDEIEAALRVEQRKRRGMEEELKQPINVHRWRTQRDERGQTYMLIRLKRQRQKQLQAVRDETEDKGRRLQAAMALYHQLAVQVEREKGMEGGGVGEEVRQSVRDRCKALAGALGVARRQKGDLDRDLAALQREKQDLVLQYVHKRQTQEREQRRVERAGAGEGQGVEGEGEVDDDDVLAKRSFAEGEEYDQEGNLILPTEGQGHAEEHKEQLTSS